MSNLTGILCETILLGSSILYYLKTKDLFHPSFIISALWAIILILYNHYNHSLFQISDTLYILITTWGMCFSMTSYISSRIKFKGFVLFRYNCNKFTFNKNVFLIILTLNLLLIFCLVKQAGSSYQLASLRDASIEEIMPLHMKLLYYINHFTVIYVLGLFYLCDDKKYYLKIFLITFILLITLIFKTNKTGFIIFFIGLAYILYKKKTLKLKYIIIGGIALCGLLAATTITRGDTDNTSFNWQDYAIIYILSPLPAMDMVLNNELTIHYGDWGSITFKFFYTIMNMMGIPSEQTTGGGWVSVPLPTNVYTVLRPFFLDFGICGVILFSIILGWIWGYLYNLQNQNRTIYVIFYSSMIYSLFVQFFSDYFFGFFSVTIQSILFSWIVCCLLSGKSNIRIKTFTELMK